MATCEQFIQGAEKVDYMRRVISRVINTLVSLLEKCSDKFTYKQCIFKMQLSEKVALYYIVDVTHITDLIQRKRNDSRGGPKWIVRVSIFDNRTDPRSVTNLSEGIPIDSVALLYKKLDEVVTLTDCEFPDAGIAAHFEKIASLA
jgi:hypothetical protein